MDDGTGAGSAKLLDDGSIEIEFAYHNGDRDFFNSLPTRFGRNVVWPFTQQRVSPS
jgi:hypothetical protein